MNITLTPEQIDAICKPVYDAYELRFEKVLKDNMAHVERLKRGYERKLEASKARANDWKMRYQSTRSELLKARAEIYALNKELKEWK